MGVLQELEVAAREALLRMKCREISCFFFFFIGIFMVNSQNSVDEILKKYNSGDVPYISVEELRMKQLDDGVLILDARQPEEFNVSHISKAVFLGDETMKMEVLDTVPVHREIVVYCSLGVRSERASEKIIKRGFRNVRNLYGGIFEWKNKDYPVVNSDGENTDKVHAYSRQWAKWLNNAEKVY